MKKAVIASLLMAASFAPHANTIAFGQAADAGQVQMPAAEYASYTACANATTAAAKAPACEAYLTAYPQSTVKVNVLQQVMGAYYSQNLPDKTLDAADRLLQVDPNNLRAIALEQIFRKQGADALTDPAAKQAGLDAAASYATKGLAAPKPKDMADADYKALQTSFYSAIATAALAKGDYPTAITNYKTELASVPVDQTTKPGAILQDTYELGIAYYKSVPPDYVNCTWYTSRAAAFAPDPFKTQFLQYATYCYKKYHGKADGYEAVTAAVQTSLDPPADFKIEPAPKPADLAHAAVAPPNDTPEAIAGLNPADKEFVLANGSTEDATKVWDVIKGKTVELPDVTVVAATDSSLQVSVSEDSVQAKTADFTFTLKEPLKTLPETGSKITLTGTYASYTPSPLMITMSDAAVVPAKKGPVKKATAKAPVRKKK